MAQAVSGEQPRRLYSQPELYTRRAVLAFSGALFGLSVGAHVERAMASPLSTLQSARDKLNEVDGLITAAKWDSVRTLLAKDPVNRTKEACNNLVASASNEARGAIVGLREDLMSGIQLLDTSVYSNVFVGEDREILGTKVDYDVPRLYLTDVKEALDGLIEIAELASE